MVDRAPANQRSRLPGLRSVTALTPDWSPIVVKPGTPVGVFGWSHLYRGQWFEPATNMSRAPGKW